MENRVAGADMREEGIAKSLSFGGSLHQSSDIDDIQIGRDFAVINEMIKVNETNCCSIIRRRGDEVWKSKSQSGGKLRSTSGSGRIV